jgi:hypothetical protein
VRGATAATMYTDKFGLWRSLASALAWGARGPGFKSRQPDQIPQRLTAREILQTYFWSPNWSPFLGSGRHVAPTFILNTLKNPSRFLRGVQMNS